MDNAEKQITFSKVKKAYDDFFAFNGIMFGCGVVACCIFAERMNGVTEEERQIIKQDVMERVIENYKDARKILGW